MRRRRHISVVLFFTRDIALRTWVNGGMFEREVALYRRLQDRGVQFSFVTYGDESDLCYGERIRGIRICAAPGGPRRYDGRNPLEWVPPDVLAQAHLIKTNQTCGAEFAVAAARRRGKPLIARCGYMWSEAEARRHGVESRAARRSREIEELAFTAANRIVVTTDTMRADVAQRFPDLAERIRVIPNYVDTNLFRPAEAPATGRRLCFVGRLNQAEKNLRALVEAVRGLDVHLDLIGDGELRGELELEAARNPRIRLLGTVPHPRLPFYLQQSAAFVLPSFHEGHPKALMEAMACGLPVIAADVPGVNDVVQHEQTGWLGAPTADGLRAGIRAVLGDPARAAKLGRTARESVVRNYALERIVDMELGLYQEVMAGARRAECTTSAR
jgi:glycosyltransferase involved in cell wall biosynthesis